MNKIGITTYLDNVENDSVFRMIADMAKTGKINSLEIMNWPKSHKEETGDFVDKIYFLKDEYGLETIFHMPRDNFSVGNTESENKYVEDKFMQNMVTARRLGVSYVIADFPKPSVFLQLEKRDFNKKKSEVIEFTNKLIRKNKEIEGNPCILLKNGCRVKYAGVHLEDFDILTGNIAYDIGHEYILCGSDTPIVERFGDRIKHVELSSNLGWDDFHLPLNENPEMIVRRVENLKSIGYKGIYNLDVPYMDVNHLSYDVDFLTELLD